MEERDPFVKYSPGQESHRELDPWGSPGAPTSLSESQTSKRPVPENKADGVWETTSEVAIWFLHTCVLITIYMCTDTSTHCVHTHRKGKTPSLMAESWFFLNLCSSVECLVYFLCLYTNKHFSTYVSAWAFFLSPFFICINIFVINCIEEDLSFIFLGKPDQELFMKNFLHIMNLFFHVICTSVHFSETNSVWYGIPLPKWAISTFKTLVHLVNKNESHWEIWFSKNYCKSLYTYLYQNLLYLPHIYILFNNVLLNMM